MSTTYVNKMAKQKGKKIVEAKTAVELHVESRDIKKALRGNSKHCAFAECLKRERPIQAAYVFRSVAFLEYADRIERYVLPPSMQKEIVAFDRNKTMAPGTYRLSVPSRNLTLQAAQQRNSHRKGRHEPKGSKIKRKMVLHRTKDIRSLAEPS
jgi:hypothetical protein